MVPNKKWLFEKMDDITPENVTINDNQIVYNCGMKMPRIMCLWQNGVYTSSQAKELVLRFISDALNTNKVTKNEAHVLESIADQMFDLDKFTASRKLNESAMELLDQLQKLQVLGKYNYNV